MTPDTPSVSVLLPCRGRVEQTLALLPRLLDTAGYDNWELTCIADGDLQVADALQGAGYSPWVLFPRCGYWHALSYATQRCTSTLLANIANDLLPGKYWLRRAVRRYQERYSTGDGVVGFNDGIHDGGHAAHMLVSRSLLHRWYGDNYWPVQYSHLWGDREICQRAMQEGIFAVAEYSVLFHNHFINGAPFDPVYGEGARSGQQGMALYEHREAHGWGVVQEDQHV